MENLQTKLRKAYESRTSFFGEPPPPIIKERIDLVRQALVRNPLPSGCHAQLLVLSDKTESWYNLSRSITIGADKHSDCRLDSKFISARHCVLQKEGDCWLLVDGDSTNGVYVNGSKVKRTYLKDGDIIQLCDFRLIFFRD